MENFDLGVFGAFGFGLALLLLRIRELRADAKADHAEKLAEIKELKQELKDERKEHDAYVDKVADAFNLSKKQ